MTEKLDIDAIEANKREIALSNNAIKISDTIDYLIDVVRAERGESKKLVGNGGEMTDINKLRKDWHEKMVGGCVHIWRKLYAQELEEQIKIKYPEIVYGHQEQHEYYICQTPHGMGICGKFDFTTNGSGPPKQEFPEHEKDAIVFKECVEKLSKNYDIFIFSLKGDMGFDIKLNYIHEYRQESLYFRGKTIQIATMLAVLETMKEEKECPASPKNG